MINLIYTVLPIITLMIGFYFGFKIGKQNEIPKVEIKTPVQIIEEHREKKQEKVEAEEIDKYLSNIDNYPNNQKKI